MNKKVLFMTQAAAIAAIYVVLTTIAAGFDLASGAIQVRFSEALCVLPFFTPAAIPGLAIGCLVANTLTGAMLPDIIFGTLATLIGAIFSYLLRKHRFLCTLPPVISNMIIIPPILHFVYKYPGGIPFFVLTVGIGEAVSCVILGSILLTAIIPVRHYIFGDIEKK